MNSCPGIGDQISNRSPKPPDLRPPAHAYSENLADLIKTTRAALADEVAPTPEPTPAYVPAVSIRKSLSSPDHIISLIDGKPYKTLKRHLTSHGLTADQYRERYKLPKSYPLVAQTYSAARRAVAQKLGLGKKPVVAAEPVVPASTPDTAAAPAPVAVKTNARKAPAKVKSTKAAAPMAQASAKLREPDARAPSKKAARRRLSIAVPKGELDVPAVKGKPSAPSSTAPKLKADKASRSPAQPQSAAETVSQGNGTQGAAGSAENSEQTNVVEAAKSNL
ncbi:MucR family transcriptional regulator [Sphingobium sp. CFD-2]|uniref:MucR family transcriptional regulator n=1 Tax=Sphingobium sp. CFD-2 TaxID=2878542 RepID=UPI00214AF877|nr:MucR family transcriptional regulator [Sphingobium sp. CFD-2]